MTDAQTTTLAGSCAAALGATAAIAEGALSVPVGLAVTCGIALVGAVWVLVQLVAKLVRSATTIELTGVQQAAAHAELRAEVRALAASLASDHEQLVKHLARSEGEAEE